MAGNERAVAEAHDRKARPHVDVDMNSADPRWHAGRNVGVQIFHEFAGTQVARVVQTVDGLERRLCVGGREAGIEQEPHERRPPGDLDAVRRFFDDGFERCVAKPCGEGHRRAFADDRRCERRLDIGRHDGTREKAPAGFTFDRKATATASLQHGRPQPRSAVGAVDLYTEALALADSLEIVDAAETPCRRVDIRRGRTGAAQQQGKRVAPGEYKLIDGRRFAGAWRRLPRLDHCGGGRPKFNGVRPGRRPRPPAAVLALADRVRLAVEHRQCDGGEPRRAVLATEKRRHRLAGKQAPKIDRTPQNRRHCMHVPSRRADRGQRSRQAVSFRQRRLPDDVPRLLLGRLRRRFGAVRRCRGHCGRRRLGAIGL